MKIKIKIIEKFFPKVCFSHFIISFSIVFFIYGCTIKPEIKQAAPNNDSILRVGLVLGVPQLLSSDKDGNLSGLEIELLNHFAKDNGYLLETTLYEKEELFFALRRGEVDIAVPCGTDSLISSNFLAPCAPHFKTGQRVIVKKTISMFINDMVQLNKEDVTVLTVAGSVSANFAKKLFPEAKKISFKDIEACITRVKNDKGYVLLVDACQAWILKTSGYNIIVSENTKEKKSVRIKLDPVLPPLTDEQICWAVRRSDLEWQKFLNGYMLELKKRGSLQELIEKNCVDAINE